MISKLIKAKKVIQNTQIATQAQNLVNQLETITQLRRELNQWKDQAKNWQDHFLRVEEERCAHFSRIDEFIIEKLEKFQVCCHTQYSLLQDPYAL